MISSLKEKLIILRDNTIINYQWSAIRIYLIKLNLKLKSKWKLKPIIIENRLKSKIIQWSINFRITTLSRKCLKLKRPKNK